MVRDGGLETSLETAFPCSAGRIAGNSPSNAFDSADGAATKILPTSTALKLPRYSLQYQSLRGESLCSLQEFAQRCRAASSLWFCSWLPAAGAAAARRLRATRLPRPTAPYCGTTFVAITDADGDFLSYSVDVTSLKLKKANGAPGRDAAGDDAYRLRTATSTSPSSSPPPPSPTASTSRPRCVSTTRTPTSTSSRTARR